MEDAAAVAKAPVLRVLGLTKSFSGQQILHGVDIEFRPGEIHALVGENGAGKSTLANIVAGNLRPDHGRVEVDGHAVELTSPRMARGVGINFVSQELTLLPLRTVIENVYCGQLPTTIPGVVSRRRMRAEFTRLLRDTGLLLPPDQPVHRLNAVQQEFVEILRAVAGGARLLILDEPTTATTPDQAEQIYALMRGLATRGVAVVLISHDLGDVLRVCDRVSVLRDGRMIRTVPCGDITRAELIKAMIGRELSEMFPARTVAADATRPVLQVDRLTRRGEFYDVSLTVGAGEVVGVAGLVGSGRSELLMALGGATRPESGTITVRNVVRRFRSVRAAMRAGIALVPENRKLQGLHLDHSVERNITLPHLDSLRRVGLVERRASRAMAASGMARTGVRTATMNTPVRALSGGNQQRVLFAKWMTGRPDVLLVDEPTRGVDVQGKAAIYQLIVDLAAAGTAVVLVSSETSEVIGLCHRVLVLHQRRVAAELVGAEITEEGIVTAAFGGGRTQGAPVS